ncbi:MULTISPECIES: ABC transporter ATP-binding protein [unclassified Arthrobacter]|uniref:ATP-binding cassette domain-containing protein n=1 Tax=unclassified Arthrobacter TaxID=235627 RepID=UPI001486201F|nr:MULTISPECIES: ABC transporter ATP-binding protein [unclassified Arthrobacter]
MHNSKSTLLDIQDLRVSFGGEKEAVRGVNLHVAEGEIAALVGESGSGKSATAMSILRLLPETAKTAGSIGFGNENLLKASQSRLLSVRGGEIGTVFQEPMTALNPALRIGRQLAGAIRGADKIGRKAILARCVALLDAVHIRDPKLKLHQFPHELSGGQRQRVMIAMAIANNPKLLIADEPTTALDVTVQAEILNLIRELRDELGMGVLLITHDLGVVADIADSVNVMHRGEIVEYGSVFDVLEQPRMDYTRHLLENSSTENVRVVARLESAEGAPSSEVMSAAPTTSVLSFKGLSVRYPGMRSSQESVVKSIDFELSAHETLAIVGESGSGKSTLGRAIAGLLPSTFEHAAVEGEGIARSRDLRGALTASFVFQDSASSLNPRLSIGDSILAPRLYSGAPKAELTDDAAAKLLESVGIDPGWITLFPHQLSGGQRQRVSIARAISRPPQLLIADEPTSALDVAVQKRILILLARLQRELRFSCVFITHDLHLVRDFADRVMVMQGGCVQEEGPVDEVLSRPKSEYTQKLLASTLSTDLSGRRVSG